MSSRVACICCIDVSIDFDFREHVEDVEGDRMPRNLSLPEFSRGGILSPTTSPKVHEYARIVNAALIRCWSFVDYFGFSNLHRCLIVWSCFPCLPFGLMHMEASPFFLAFQPLVTWSGVEQAVYTLAKITLQLGSKSNAKSNAKTKRQMIQMPHLRPSRGRADAKHHSSYLATASWPGSIYMFMYNHAYHIYIDTDNYRYKFYIHMQTEQEDVRRCNKTKEDVRRC